MAKSLQDWCLACIAVHIASYNRLGNFLSLRHKELLLERICWHGQLLPENTPSVIYNLFSHTLQRINLSYSTQVDDKMLELLGRSGCKPKFLTIHDCPDVTDKGIASLVLIWRTVEELSLTKLKHFTGEGLKGLSSRNLTSVYFQESTGITDTSIIRLVQNCPNISVLNLSELHKVTDLALVQVAEQLNNKLVELELSDMNLITSESTIALAKHCKNLSEAHFESCVRLDGHGLVQMAESCSLSNLCISFCYKVAPKHVDVLVSLLRAKGKLHTFDAMGIGVTSLALEMLASTRSLTNLILCGVPKISDENIEMVTKEAGNTLSHLDISNCLALTDRSCISISKHCKVLEVLGLRNLQEIKGTDLSSFFLNESRAKGFKSITLSGSKNLQSVVVETIAAHCPNLEVITLAGLKDITDTIAISIAHNCPNIQQISFRNCQLSDEGVCEIAIHCRKLTMIALSGIHSLTDKCVLALAEKCPFIRELYISGCAKISRQAVTYLKDFAVGRVFVKHSIPNAPFGLLMAKDLDSGEYCRVDDLEFDSLHSRTINQLF